MPRTLMRGEVSAPRLYFNQVIPASVATDEVGASPADTRERLHPHPWMSTQGVHNLEVVLIHAAVLSHASPASRVSMCSSPFAPCSAFTGVRIRRLAWTAR